MSEQQRDERSGPGAADPRAGNQPGRDSGDLLVAMSPRQILGGFALLAGLLIMLKRRGRSRRSGHDRDLDKG